MSTESHNSQKSRISRLMGVLQLTAKYWTLSGKAAKCSGKEVNGRSGAFKNGQHNSTEENAISILKCKDVTLQAFLLMHLLYLHYEESCFRTSLRQIFLFLLFRSRFGDILFIRTHNCMGTML